MYTASLGWEAQCLALQPALASCLNVFTYRMETTFETTHTKIIYLARVLGTQDKRRQCWSTVVLLISSGRLHEGGGMCTNNILTTGQGLRKNGEKNHPDQTVAGLLLAGPII